MLASSCAAFFLSAFPETSELKLLMHLFQPSALEADALQSKSECAQNLKSFFLHPVSFILRDPDDLASNTHSRYLSKTTDDSRYTSRDLMINGLSCMKEQS